MLQDVTQHVHKYYILYYIILYSILFYSILYQLLSFEHNLILVNISSVKHFSCDLGFFYMLELLRFFCGPYFNVKQLFLVVSSCTL